MNQLFEEFIAEFIRRELREVWQSRVWDAYYATGVERQESSVQTTTSRSQTVASTSVRRFDSAIAHGL